VENIDNSFCLLGLREKLIKDGKRLEASGRYLSAVVLESCRLGMEFGELSLTGAVSRKVRRRPFRIPRALDRLPAPLSLDGQFDDPLGWRVSLANRVEV
jgi:hypothetical protein